MVDEALGRQRGRRGPRAAARPSGGSEALGRQRIVHVEIVAGLGCCSGLVRIVVVLEPRHATVGH
jgi:hypothetical protein